MVFILIELQGCFWQGFPAAMAEQVVGILRSESLSNNDSRKQRRDASGVVQLLLLGAKNRGKVYLKWQKNLN